MSAARIALLGAIAGLTIFLGLPVARLRNPAPRLRALLNSGAIGVLLFLLWDVLAHAWDPVDSALGRRDYGAALGQGAVLAAGLGLGLAGLVHFDRWVARRAARAATAPAPTPAMAVAAAVPGGTPHATAATPGVPAGASPAAGERPVAPADDRQRTATQLATLIAAGIGLHNFAEGLAIGNSAAAGELGLAVLLIIGFGLHNATEGFGIVAPLAAAGTRPSWRRLALLGLIGGGPTFVGTVVGQGFTSTVVSIGFLSLAAGSILYVVIELLAVARRMSMKEITTWGLLAGLLLGFITDAIVTAAGA